MNLAHAPARVLITAGPTHEPIDRVRYIANRSSGRMGLALARAFAERQSTVTLLMGPVADFNINHPHVRVRRFRTTADLQGLLYEEWPSHDLLIMAAAVADYRPIPVPRADGSTIEKLERSADGSGLTLQLEATPDLLAGLRSITKPGQFVIGFALESRDRLAERAKAKLVRKGLDAIVANPLETMDAETIDATVFTKDGRSMHPPHPDLTKDQFARWLAEYVPPLMQR